jgi:hypothetical protein
MEFLLGYHAFSMVSQKYRAADCSSLHSFFLLFAATTLALQLRQRLLRFRRGRNFYQLREADHVGGGDGLGNGCTEADSMQRVKQQVIR